jgi:hypothetical protein
LAVALSATGLLAFAVGNPDGRIAERNVDRYERTGRIDTGVLAHLSADAVPALARGRAACSRARLRHAEPVARVVA